jgi:hypothetical protein
MTAMITVTGIVGMNPELTEFKDKKKSDSQLLSVPERTTKTSRTGTPSKPGMTAPTLLWSGSRKDNE